MKKIKTFIKLSETEKPIKEALEKVLGLLTDVEFAPEEYEADLVIVGQKRDISDTNKWYALIDLKGEMKDSSKSTITDRVKARLSHPSISHILDISFDTNLIA